MKRPAVALVLLAALAGCSSGSSTTATSPSATTSPDASAPAATSGPDTTAPTSSSSVPPLGKDLACFDRTRCYLKNPTKRTDEQIIAWLPSVAGAKQAPAASMKPWAYVVLGLGEGRISGWSAPSTSSTKVDDEFGILNHRALFAYCRRSADGSAVTDANARKDVWYRIEPVTAQAPAEVWVNGEHLYAYGHDGQIPTC